MSAPKKIENFLNSFLQRVEVLQQRLSDEIDKKIISKLDTENGNIKYSTDNLLKTQEIDKVIDDFTKRNSGVFKYYAKGLQELLKSNISYYATFNPQSAMTGLETTINHSLERMGITPQGAIVTNGLLYQVSQMQDVRFFISQQLQLSIARGDSFDVTIKNFKTAFQGDKNVNGKVFNYIKTNLHDLTYKVDQATSNQMATNLQLNYFRYSGTKVKNTRDFCLHRYGKVFHRNDVEIFPKNKPYFQDNYDFFTDRGGYNCLHVIRWISNQLGEKLHNKELIEDKDE